MLITKEANTLIDISPYMSNGFSHHYQLDESTFTFRGVGSHFYFIYLFFFSMKFLQANRIAPDVTPGLNELINAISILG